ncbi:MAG: hypothetical protein GOVbin5978_10 [Prokaryotic dsDNA virus sp.]|nr:MAG: hypothetical protein GOVbin5978_10 [Prokaryotic dsDNA virus sp.]|tara:strand:- start:22617 stop:22766 length:150 start_codon:yes stop_codon:yes gene_type:complete
MKQVINVPVYYHIDDNNKIVIDYEQMNEFYNAKIERLKIDTEITNKKYR